MTRASLAVNCSTVNTEPSRGDPPFEPGEVVSPKLLLVDVGRLHFKPVHRIDGRDKILENRRVKSREGTNRFLVIFNAQQCLESQCSAERGKRTSHEMCHRRETHERLVRMAFSPHNEVAGATSQTESEMQLVLVPEEGVGRYQEMDPKLGLTTSCSWRMANKYKISDVPKFDPSCNWESLWTGRIPCNDSVSSQFHTNSWMRIHDIQPRLPQVCVLEPKWQLEPQLDFINSFSRAVSQCWDWWFGRPTQKFQLSVVERQYVRVSDKNCFMFESFDVKFLQLMFPNLHHLQAVNHLTSSPPHVEHGRRTVSSRYAHQIDELFKLSFAVIGTYFTNDPKILGGPSTSHPKRFSQAVLPSAILSWTFRK